MKTAVEWLVNHLQKSKDWQRVLNEVSQMSSAKINLLEQAKEMEKEQIKDAYNKGEFNQGCNGDAEQYYNETFK